MRIFGIALAAAVIAILGVQRVLHSPKSATRIVTRPVVVARSDIVQGRAIERESITIAQWPLATVPVFAYANANSVVGRVARMNIFKGEVIVPGRLIPITPSP